MRIRTYVVHRFGVPTEMPLFVGWILSRLNDMDMQSARELFNNRWPAGRSVATKAELIAAGLDARAINSAVKYGILHRLRQGVYVPMKKWAGVPPWDQDKLNLSGHIAATNGQQIYSHFSAARLHGLHLWDSSRLIHVNAPYASSISRLQKDVKVHRSFYTSDAVVERFIPGTGLARYASLELTVLQCAMAAPFAQAVVIGDSALYKGLKLDVLQELLIQFTGISGVNRAGAAFNALNGLSESPGESRTRLIIAELPIPQPTLQVSLDTYTGSYRVDFAWEDIRLILEFDGNMKYFDYPTPTAQALIDERERENALIESGWRFIRIKWKHLANPEQLKARIMNAYFNAQRAAA